MKLFIKRMIVGTIALLLIYAIVMIIMFTANIITQDMVTKVLLCTLPFMVIYGLGRLIVNQKDED